MLHHPGANLRGGQLFTARWGNETVEFLELFERDLAEIEPRIYQLVEVVHVGDVRRRTKEFPSRLVLEALNLRCSKILTSQPFSTQKD